MTAGKPAIVALVLATTFAPGCAYHREGKLVPIPPPDRPVTVLLAGLRSGDAGVRATSAWALAHVEHPGLQVEDPIDVPPRALRITRPHYPAGPHAHGVEGTVLVKILIDEQGRVAHAEVRQSIPMLDAEALACVRQWTFVPASRRGRPAPIVADAPVTFRID